MAPIPKPLPSTVSAIYRSYEDRSQSWDSLGISVGEANGPCDRQLWYNIRWASALEVHTGKQLRLFDTGNREEDRLVDELGMIGVEVYGQQDKIRLVHSHVRGKCDGKGVNIPEAPKTEHLLEFKSSNEKGMKELQKHDPMKGGEGIKISKPLHYGQCQLGMHAFGLTRCLYLASSKNDDLLYQERISYDAEFCMRLLARLDRIIFAQDPPAKLHEDPNHKMAFECGWCRHRGICHDGMFPRTTCRSCLHSTPERSGDGHWSCARWSKPISFDEQKQACPTHLTIPSMVPGIQEDYDDENETVTYRLRNGELWIDGEANDNEVTA